MALRIFLWTKKTPWTWSQSRRLLSSIAEKRLAVEKHAGTVMLFWKRVSIFVAIPTCLYLTYRSFFTGDAKHVEKKEYIPYSHLRIRNKPFPWGNKTLIHNPHTNLGEPEVEEEEPKKERWNWYEKIWLDYWIEDPDEQDRIRYKHLRRMQRRRERYLKNKVEGTDPTYPTQGISLFEEMKHRAHDEMDPYIDN